MDEANKEQAEKCRDLGATALRNGDFEKAVRMLEKSLRLHSLPGVGDLLSHAKRKLADSTDGDGSSNADFQSTSNGSSRNTNGATNGGENYRRQSSAPPSTSSSSSVPRPNVAERQQSGLDGRAYTQEQVQIIKKILAAKLTGRGAHYKVLGLPNNQATENDIKKAYRKISLRVHPDKNSAPGADEAFKAVGLAYATLSDPQKRSIYDRYGDEDPDNVGGGMSGGMRRRAGGGHEMTPEEIFNAFFGGGGPGGGTGMGPGFHVYSTGFGPGMHFGGGMPRNRQPRRQQEAHDDNAMNLNMLMQLLPLILIILVSFFNSSTYDSTQRSMPGENQYFSLTNKPPFHNRLETKLSSVRGIPYFVSDKFMRTYHRDRYQLSQVERMVENAYEQYLHKECQNQRLYRKSIYQKAETLKDITEKEKMRRMADEFIPSRCDELDDLFPNRRKK